MLKYIILGVIQGLTEFFPVSSSAHLVIMQNRLGITGNGVALPVILHLGTTLALIIFFFKEIKEALFNFRLLLFIVTVTIITGIIGLSGKEFFEGLFGAVVPVGVALIVTGIMLIFTRKFMSAKRNELNLKDALILGLTQGIAIIPGISRSGTTISTLLFRGVSRDTAFKMSFIASIPAVLGAVLLEAKDISFALKNDFTNMSVGFIFSFLFGLFSLWLLKLILHKAKLHYFGYYCIFVAIIALLFMK